MTKPPRLHSLLLLAHRLLLGHPDVHTRGTRGRCAPSVVHDGREFLTGPEGDRIASTLTFKLVTVDGAPAEPPSFKTVAPPWRPGDMIPLGGRTLRVVGVHPSRYAIEC